MTAFDRRDLLAAGVAALGTVTLPRRGTAQPARPAASSQAATTGTMAPEPFQVAVPQATLDRIARQLRDHEWGHAPISGGWRYGTDQDYLRRLVAYWQDGYDWRRTERTMNGMAHFRVPLVGQQLHYVVEKGSGPRPLPLLLIHGWPYSFWSFREVVGPLAHPERFGGSADDGFELVLPSIPGFDLSEAPPDPIGLRAISGRLHRLMTEVLGHERYVVAGGDFGAVIGSWLAFDHPESVVGLWQDAPAQRQAGTAFDSPHPAEPANEQEKRAAAEARALFFREFGYFHLQVTRPQTLATALADNPVGQASWIVEKVHSWTDLRERPFEQVWGMDALLDNVMLYAATGSFGTSVWPYYGFQLPGETPELPPGRKIEVPTAVASWHDPLTPMPPREVMALSRGRIVQWSDMPRGGHFPFHEAPDLYVDDIRKFGRTLRG